MLDKLFEKQKSQLPPLPPNPLKFLAEVEKGLNSLDKQLRMADRLLRVRNFTELEEIWKFREELEKAGAETETREVEEDRKKYPLDLRYDAAITRLQRLKNIFESYKKTKSRDDLNSMKNALNHLRQIYVCPGCDEIESSIAELLEAIENGAKPEETIPIIESYMEGLTFAIEGANVMLEKWGYTKPLTDLTEEEKEFIRREVEKRLVGEYD